MPWAVTGRLERSSKGPARRWRWASRCSWWATPIVWAQGLTRELGDARLITVEGTTHTSSLDGNPCLDAAISAYLVRLKAPKIGLRCGA